MTSQEAQVCFGGEARASPCSQKSEMLTVLLAAHFVLCKSIKQLATYQCFVPRLVGPGLGHQRLN